MIDELPAPARPALKVAIDPAHAERLAYYQAEDGPGVFAPRGWQCYTEIGSSSIMIRAEPMLPGFRDKAWREISGPAVVSIFFFAQTSGRHTVADLDALVFPHHAAFIRHVETSEAEDRRNIERRRGPLPDDSITRLNPDLVAFGTKPNGVGLGAYARLSPGPAVIRGLAKNCGDEDGVYVLAARLPLSQNDLTPAIVGPDQPEGFGCLSQQVS